MNYKWKLEPPTPEKQEAAERLAKELNISPILGRLLIERNITTVADAKKFFRPSLTGLYDPFMFTDMDRAVERLNKALGRKERIMVYGDYDVDGCTAVALVYKFLQQYYSNIDYYIPDRYEEGYGVSVKGIDYAYESEVKLIIVLDCGIKAVDEIAYAKEKGIDFIICDHHVPDEILPPAVAILNAKRFNSTYPACRNDISRKVHCSRSHTKESLRTDSPASSYRNLSPHSEYTHATLCYSPLRY